MPSFQSVMAQCLSSFTELYKLLPDNQMGSRKNTSTETALELLTEQTTMYGALKARSLSTVLRHLRGVRYRQPRTTTRQLKEETGTNMVRTNCSVLPIRENY